MLLFIAGVLPREVQLARLDIGIFISMRCLPASQARSPFSVASIASGALRPGAAERVLMRTVIVDERRREFSILLGRLGRSCSTFN